MKVDKEEKLSATENAIEYIENAIEEIEMIEELDYIRSDLEEIRSELVEKASLYEKECMKIWKKERYQENLDYERSVI